MSEAVSTETIAAIATPSGRGGIGIVRISGSQALPIAENLCHVSPRERYVEFAAFFDASGEPLDKGLLLFFKGPASFTGEDVIELHGHGGPVVMDMLMERVLQLGAREARPGEFTERAFLNDKIDLVQAESIADLIDSQSRTAARFAARSLQGEFSSRIHGLQSAMIDLRMYIEAAMDFPEEEVDFLSDSSVQKKLSTLRKTLETLLKDSRLGAIVRQGVRVVLAGRPNVGKSSLMNLLSQRDSAIVTHIPGTTRDLVREEINLDGLQIELVDTAGIREKADIIETEGIRRALSEVTGADIVLLLLDAGSVIRSEIDIEEEISRLRKSTAMQGQLLLAINKVDSVDVSQLNELLSKMKEKGGPEPVEKISALQGKGVPALIQHIKAMAGMSNLPESGFIARSRHIKALELCQQHLDQALAELQTVGRGELVAEDLRLAHAAMGSILGEFTADDLLGEIFSRFCIGK
ncbi:MAG: tRNA uridine-5-carboxymethylaminomethyl(34) synthesis GTPase MnmE [Gammaproteobacteria bacterium]|nr:tRNA uridine-5-carboxymethylaminomethyl(34) synthesis GTPase MnmE [Gammaproteobacteria bacterium]